ncbi:MAG TPA: protein kinase [Gemmataceae bacterium]|nr:protein kinase [Gemmataceae bacterium]
MPAPATSEEFLDLVRKTDVVDPKVLNDYLEQLRAAGPLPAEPNRLAALLVRDGLLTNFQAGLFLLGRTTGFTIGKYRILERLGTGGMGSVFLCEDRNLRRRVAVKVLPPRIAKDPASLARFHREAQVVAVLDHPNIVHALDFCQDDNLYYLVMEFIDGHSLQEIVDKQGPLDLDRACHYIRQAARGLEHAFKNGLVHRDIKPGNILVDKSGTVKILDLGLARFTDSRNEAITTRFDDNSVMGTADYLSPEQAVSLHDVDTRADIYSLGMTFYFLLAGHPPFKEGTVAQKLIWHQLKQPTPIREIRPEVPEELAAILDKMIAKDPARRYQTPGEVDEALAPWTQTPVPRPPEIDGRRLSPAALGSGPPTGAAGGAATLRGSFSWVLPDSGSGPATPRPQGTATQVARGFGDTPTPSGANTAAELLKPIDEDEVKNGPKSGRKSAAVQDRAPLSPPPRKRPASREEPIDEDVEVVEDDEGPPSAKKSSSSSSSIIRPGEKGRKHGTSSSTKLRKRRKKGRFISDVDWRLWGPIGAGALLFLFVLLGVFVWLYNKSSPSPDEMADDTSPGLAQQNRTKPGRLVVSHDVQPNSFPTLRAALENAIPGDVIVVQLDTLEETLRVDGDKGHGKEVTIESGLPKNRRVIWKAPPTAPPEEPILEVSGVSNLVLKGFQFDGQKQTHDLVVISGRCPGLALDNVHFNNFRKCGVRLKQCAGEDKRLVALRSLRFFSPDNSAEACVTLEGGPGQGSEHIRVEQSRFEGPCRSGILLSGPMTNVLIQRNRIWKTTDGVVWKKAEKPAPLQLVVVSNTFADLRHGLHLEALPPADQTRLEIKNNLFYLVRQRLARTDQVPTQPDKLSTQWIWSEEGQATGQDEVPISERYFRRTFEVDGGVMGAVLNIAADETFQVWLNGEKVGESAHPYFTRRVYAFDVKLQPGRNVLAVQADNKFLPNSKQLTRAGLLVRLAAGPTGRPLVSSDKEWKVALEAPEGWQGLDFNDREWQPVKVLGPYNSKRAPWSNLVWDAIVRQHFNNKPPTVVVSGNVCDPDSPEGYPLLDARVVDFKLPTEPKNDGQFLRYDKKSLLNNKFIGAPGFGP